MHEHLVHDLLFVLLEPLVVGEPFLALLLQQNHRDNQQDSGSNRKARNPNDLTLMGKLLSTANGHGDLER